MNLPRPHASQKLRPWLARTGGEDAAAAAARRNYLTTVRYHASLYGWRGAGHAWLLRPLRFLCGGYDQASATPQWLVAAALAFVSRAFPGREGKAATLHSDRCATTAGRGGGKDARKE